MEVGPFKVVFIADYKILREYLCKEVFNSRGNYNHLLNGKPPLRGGNDLYDIPGIIDAEGERLFIIRGHVYMMSAQEGGGLRRCSNEAY